MDITRERYMSDIQTKPVFYSSKVGLDILSQSHNIIYGNIRKSTVCVACIPFNEPIDRHDQI